MTREEKISAIYEAMANKELTLGCKVIMDNEELIILEVEEYIAWQAFQQNKGLYLTFSYDEKPTIIGHPIMIGDVMYYIRKKYWNNHSWFHDDRDKLIDLRSKEREPIEGQYDECIDFVYSLIPKS